MNEFAAGAHRAFCFNLVIERLLISGWRVLWWKEAHRDVSISLSSGFSFQDPLPIAASAHAACCFNLVIERLLISGQTGGLNITHVVQFQSRYRAASHFRLPAGANPRDIYFYVSISLSSGFSFQALLDLENAGLIDRSFNLVIERLLISGLDCEVPHTQVGCRFQSRYRAASHFRSGSG